MTVENTIDIPFRLAIRDASGEPIAAITQEFAFTLNGRDEVHECVDASLELVNEA
jgi:hypothetical protein